MKERYEAPRRRRSSRSKSLALVLSLVLVIGCVAGGTLAWLNAQTEDVTNTFSPSDIGVTLTESFNKDTDNDGTSDAWEAKMIPGWTIDKDPKATVTSGSEDCYLFVKVEKSDNFDTYMDMAVDSQWDPVTDTDEDGIADDGVYYIVIDEEGKKNVAYNVLGEGEATYSNVKYTWSDNQVLVKPTVTEEMMTTAKTNQPTLTFTAYAVQLWKSNEPDAGATGDQATTAQFTPAEAWNLAQTLDDAN